MIKKKNINVYEMIMNLVRSSFHFYLSLFIAKSRTVYRHENDPLDIDLSIELPGKYLSIENDRKGKYLYKKKDRKEKI